MADPAIYIAVLGALAGNQIIAPMERAYELVVIVEPDADGVIRMAATVPGGDIIYAAAASDSERDRWLTTRVEVDDRGSLQGDALIELGAGPDLVRGGKGFDIAKMGCGDDLAYMGAGDDWAYGGCGDDVLVMGAGDDHAFGGKGADTLYCGTGDDLCSGGKGFDEIHGGPGADLIICGRGIDIAWGGRGRDVFADDCEEIMDFDPAEDVIIPAAEALP